MLFCIVISTAYAGILSSSMTIPFMTPTIKTFNELAQAMKAGKIKAYTHVYSHYCQFLKVKHY